MEVTASAVLGTLSGWEPWTRVTSMASRKALPSEVPSPIGLNFRPWQRPGGSEPREQHAPPEVPETELTLGWKPWACVALASSGTFPLEKKGTSPRMCLKQACGDTVTLGA